MQEFLTFRTFNDKETAADFADVLKETNIPFLIEEDSLVFDASFANNPLDKTYLLKIKQEDFVKASSAYERYFENQLNHVESDYYLFDFSNQELEEIVAKPDEWGSFDYQLAQKLLRQRGQEISENVKESLKTKRYKEIAEPAQEKNITIALIYFICYLSIPVALITGNSIPLYFFPIGLYTGWVWGYSKKTLPDGQRMNAYNDHVRKHGLIIFRTGLGLFILIIISMIFAPVWINLWQF